jgi:hypothetical protein
LLSDGSQRQRRVAEFRPDRAENQAQSLEISKELTDQHSSGLAFNRQILCHRFAPLRREKNSSTAFVLTGAARAKPLS